MNQFLSQEIAQHLSQFSLTKEYLANDKLQTPLKTLGHINESRLKTEATTPNTKNSISKRHSVRNSSRRVLKTPEKNTEHLFRPLINERSQKIMKKFQNNSQNCWENLYEDSFCKKNKIDTARKQGIEQEFKNKDFTFHPIIISRNKSSIDLVTRTYSWLKQKNQKIHLKIEEETDKDLQGCTFMPKINEFRDEGAEVLKNIKGVEKFLGRKKVSRNESPQKSVTRVKNISVKEYEEAVKDLSLYLHSIDISYNSFDQ